MVGRAKGTEAEHVRPGRPRDPEVDEAILSATLDLLAAEGYARLTMDRVALKAAVAKTSLYRRWPSKESLVVEAIQRVQMAERPVVPDTGSLRRDMLGYLRSLVRYRRAQSDAIAAVMSEIIANRELADAVRQHVVGTLLSSFRVIVERSIARGELPSSTDVELLSSLPLALVHQRRLLTGEPADEAFAKRIVDQFFDLSSPTPLRPKTR